MSERRDPDDFDMTGDEWREAIARAKSPEMRAKRRQYEDQRTPQHTCGAITMTSATTRNIVFRNNHFVVPPDCPGCSP